MAPGLVIGLCDRERKMVVLMKKEAAGVSVVVQ